MTITRISLDSVAWPLWALAVAHFIFAFTSLAAFIEAQNAKQELQQSTLQMQRDMQKAVKAIR